MALLPLSLLVMSASAAPPAFPLFKQCDPVWASDEMGTPGPGERATVCKEGCAMSCVAMAMAGYGLAIPPLVPGVGPGTNVTPGTLNSCESIACVLLCDLFA